jgi:hypothetical protein
MGLCPQHTCIAQTSPSPARPPSPLCLSWLLQNCTGALSQLFYIVERDAPLPPNPPAPPYPPSPPSPSPPRPPVPPLPPGAASLGKMRCELLARAADVPLSGFSRLHFKCPHAAGAAQGVRVQNAVRSWAQGPPCQTRSASGSRATPLCAWAWKGCGGVRRSCGRTSAPKPTPTGPGGVTP